MLLRRMASAPQSWRWLPEYHLDAGGHLSQRGRIPVDRFADSRLEPAIAGNIDLLPQQVLEFQHQRRVVQQARRIAPANQQIEIALRARFAACHGSYDANVVCAVPGS